MVLKNKFGGNMDPKEIAKDVNPLDEYQDEYGDITVRRLIQLLSTMDKSKRVKIATQLGDRLPTDTMSEYRIGEVREFNDYVCTGRLI